MTERAEPTSIPPPFSAFGLLVAVHFVLFLGGGITLAVGGWDVDELPIGASFLAAVPFWVAGVSGSWLLARRHGDPVAVLRATLRPIDLPLGLLTGAAVQVIVLPIVYWPVLRVLDENYDTLEESARKVVDSASGAFGIATLVVMTCVMAPVVEETLYRGVLQRSLEPSGRFAAVAVSSVAFAAFHFQPLQFLGLAIIGAVAGVAVIRTGRLGTAVMIHAGFNAATVVYLLS